MRFDLLVSLRADPRARTACARLRPPGPGAVLLQAAGEASYGPGLVVPPWSPSTTAPATAGGVSTSRWAAWKRNEKKHKPKETGDTHQKKRKRNPQKYITNTSDFPFSKSNPFRGREPPHANFPTFRNSAFAFIYRRPTYNISKGDGMRSIPYQINSPVG